MAVISITLVRGAIFVARRGTRTMLRAKVLRAATCPLPFLLLVARFANIAKLPELVQRTRQQ